MLVLLDGPSALCKQKLSSGFLAGLARYCDCFLKTVGSLGRTICLHLHNRDEDEYLHLIAKLSLTQSIALGEWGLVFCCWGREVAV